ncbi:hypothetical protein BWR17_19100 (plasmid) [Phaeobacter inhibens]|uniref:TRAP transporter small permease subunit n=1 Tax=Phaeobacter inhibens TaxID=221822 RepID=UPI0009719CFF|nr:TRAP transporter small permease subunit [Phaeobacter inhibens]APX18000.1 hypothetical protein BWR17_19100 [Phaeobacter inhibens]
MSEHPHLRGSTLIDHLIHAVGALAKWLALALVLLQFGIVVSRYIFDTGSVMAQEAVLYLFGALFMLSLADALARNRHVRVDLLFSTMGARGHRRIDAIGTILFLLPLCGFVLYHSWGYVAASWLAREGSREAAGLPGVYLFKTVILIAFFLLILQGAMIFLRCLTGTKSND